MIPEIDSKIGITIYSTKFAGCGGRIKVSADDFRVSEKIKPKTQSLIKENEGYAVYVLKKQGIDTFHALEKIQKKTGLRLKSLGLKDSNATTEQFVCGINKSKSLENFSSSKFSINRIGFTKKPLSKKDMIGNKFRIKISNAQDFSSFGDSNKILNFYGYQRFGSNRPVNHHIGKAILKGDYEDAVSLLLSYTTKYETKENQEIRTKLKDQSNFASILPTLPSGMDLERTALEQMIETSDPKHAIRALPISIRRFFVQSFQAFLFNKTLSMAFTDGENLYAAIEGDICFNQEGIIDKYTKGLDQFLAIPFIGYAYYKKTRFNYQIQKILEEQEITPKDFFVKDMQEVSSEGGFRNSQAICNDFVISDDVVSFTLSRGSYATIVLREIMKPKDPLEAGF